MPRLLTIAKAAAELGVPQGSLVAAARKHGLIVKMGRARRIDPNDFPELIKQCQDQPQDHGCIAAKTAAVTTLSATPEAESSRRALAAAKKLKKLLPGTSQRNNDRPGQPSRVK